MLKKTRYSLRGMAILGLGLLMLMLFTACAGLATTGGSATITGSITSVDSGKHSVTLSVNGQSLIINGLTDQQISALQSQQNKVYQFSVTQNNDGTYTINPNAAPVATNSTPGVTTTTTNGSTPTSSAVANGNLSFIGKVQSIATDSVVVSLPGNDTLTIMIVTGQTDLSSFKGARPTANQVVKVKANSNADGSFTATEIKTTDNGDLADLNKLSLQGLTTSPVGSDNQLKIQVGNKSFTFTITPGTTDLGDFNNNAQSISSHQNVQVDVQYQGSNATVMKIKNAGN